MLTDPHGYVAENLRQRGAETDGFTADRYRHFASLIPPHARVVLDVGCSTGRGGSTLAGLRPELRLWGLDVVPSRLAALPDVYAERLLGITTELPLEDGSVDVVLAGELVEHLRPHDVDPTLCEFQRVLRVGGRLLLTTPNPNSLKLRLTGGSVYGPGHLTQHHAADLRRRVRMHGFRAVHVTGTGRMSRYVGRHVPVLALYGSYLVRADKR